MTILRWIAFIPVAFISSVLAGVVGYWCGNFFGSAWFDLGEVAAWIASGLTSSLAFVVVGLKVAPVKNNKAKWSLVSILFVLGSISAIGAFFGGDTPVSAFAGAIMVCIAVGVGTAPIEKLDF